MIGGWYGALVVIPTPQHMLQPHTNVESMDEKMQKREDVLDVEIGAAQAEVYAGLWREVRGREAVMMEQPTADGGGKAVGGGLLFVCVC